jgi:hypothetical protein
LVVLEAFSTSHAGIDPSIPVKEGGNKGEKNRAYSAGLRRWSGCVKSLAILQLMLKNIGSNDRLAFCLGRLAKPGAGVNFAQVSRFFQRSIAVF